MSGRQRLLVLTHIAANIKKKKKRTEQKQKNSLKSSYGWLSYSTVHSTVVSPAALSGQLLVKLSSTAVSVQLSYGNGRPPDPHPSLPDLVTYTGLRRLPQGFHRTVCSR